MKSARTRPSVHAEFSADQVRVQGVDRRCFLQYAAAVAATIGIPGSALALPSAASLQGTPAAAPTDSRLPDGTEYVSWEQPLNFSKTYYVDNDSRNADDNGPGTREH